MVGRVRIPPFAMAAVPRTTCSGVTEMPWPKPTVMVAMSFQFAAGCTIGMPASGNSTPVLPNMPMACSQWRCRSAPTRCAICAAPRLDE